MKFELRLQPKQSYLLKLVEESKYTRIGEGGSRGGGKSKVLRDVQLYRRFKYPKTDGWLFRRTHEELKDNHIKPLFNDYPSLREFWRQDDRELRFPNGSTLGFKFAENEGDILKFRGKQAMDVTVDESNLMRESEMRELGMCCRAPGYAEWMCKLVEGFNPGGIGHNRIKRLYVDRTFLTNEVPADYFFLPIFAWDNVSWAENALAADGLTVDDYYAWPEDQRFQYFIHRTQYGRELNALPEPTRSQMLMGSFDAFEGQVFGILDDGVHNLDNWLRDEQDWKEFLSRQFRFTGCLDHATTGTRAYLMTCQDAHDNRFALDEVYFKNRLISEMVDEVKRVKTKYPKVDRDYVDPSTESDTQEQIHELASIQDAYRREGLSTVVPPRTKISVGLDHMNTRLKVDPTRKHPFTGEMGSPGIFISRSRCPNLWLEMTELQCLVRDGKIKYVGADHLIDDLRYIEVAHMKPPKAPAEQPKPEQLNNTLPQFARRIDTKFARQWDKKVQRSRTYF